MPLEYPFAVPPIKFELPYSTWATNDAKSQLARVKAEIIALNLPFLQQKARSPNADFTFFQALSEGILTTTKLKSSKIAKLLADHLSGLLEKACVPGLISTLHQQPCHWEAPLYGLLNLLEGEIEKEPKDRDLTILQTVVSTLHIISKLVWRDLSFLLHDGAVGDYRRCLVSRTIYMMSQLPGQREKMYDATTISLVMHCWVFMSHNPINRLSASACARYLFFQTEVIPPPPAGVRYTALLSVSLETFVSREKLALENSDLLGEALAMEFKAIDPFSGQNSDLSQAFVDRKFCTAIVNALYRQVLDVEKKEKFDDDTMTVFGEGGRLIQ
ncbi:hypothetical protein CPB83DRAFT_305484 [Crepidotus variabilis]|uniref:Uncharacterized protein n=1 Tax=Crepidotus variabilis TaxID=179855 RepID=A0A9P6EGR0_9AGAR|nr:hypothetical protein CPB83DRAFT_305484 [Crepidotus variabilis]